MADLQSTRIFGRLTVLHEAILKANAEITGTLSADTVSASTYLGLPPEALIGDTTYSAGTGLSLSGTTFSLSDERYTSSEKTKLAGIETGAQVNVGTNLSVSSGTSSGPTINSSTGNNATIPSASATASGVVTTGNQTFAGTKTFNSTISGSISGNSATATALQNSRTINGTSFNGTSNITTSSWGTSRTITVGNSGKSVNGSSNVSWSLSEIGVNNSTLTLATSGIASGSQTWTSNQGSNATFTVTVPGTNLAQGGSGNSRTITSSTGDNVTISTATTSNAGFMSTDDKSKLDGIESGAEVNVGTNLGQSRNSTSYTVTSSTGSNTTLNAATTSDAGVMTAGDKSKLDGIESGAQVNVGTNLGSSGTGGTRTITSSTGSNTSITYTAADVGAVPTSRTLTGGNGINSIGNLSSNRTISVDNTVFRTSGNQQIEGRTDLVAPGGSTVFGQDEGALRIGYPANWSNDSDDDHVALRIQTNGANGSDYPYGVVGIRFATSTADDFGPLVGATRTGGGAGDLVIKTGGNSIQERFRIADNGNVSINQNLSVSGTISGNGSGLMGTASLRATGTTKDDVGLGNVNNVAQVDRSGDTMTGLLTIDNSDYKNHLFLKRGSNTAEINPSTGSNSGASPELRFEGDMEGYWFDGRVKAEDGFFGDGSGLTGTASLRATGTTKDDVGLSNIPNATTSSRTSSSTSTLLEAKAMNDHRTSGDHDSRYHTITSLAALGFEVDGGELKIDAGTLS